MAGRRPRGLAVVSRESPCAGLIHLFVGISVGSYEVAAHVPSSGSPLLLPPSGRPSPSWTVYHLMCTARSLLQLLHASGSLKHSATLCD